MNRFDKFMLRFILFSTGFLFGSCNVIYTQLSTDHVYGKILSSCKEIPGLKKKD